MFSYIYCLFRKLIIKKDWILIFFILVLLYNSCYLFHRNDFSRLYTGKENLLKLLWNFWDGLRKTQAHNVQENVKMQIPSCLQILHNSSTLFHHRAFFRGRVYIIRLPYRHLFITYLLFGHTSPQLVDHGIYELARKMKLRTYLIFVIFFTQAKFLEN